MIDIENIFDRSVTPIAFAKVDDELSAIRSGRKAMSVFTMQIDQKGALDSPVATEALSMGLSVSIQIEQFETASGPRQQAYIFVLDPREGWRVPAYMATRQALRRFGWSDSMEYYESFLLGYQSTQIDSWMSHLAHTRASWQSITIYFISSTSYKGELEKLGFKCFADPVRSVDEDVTIFLSLAGFGLRTDAHQLAPKDLVIGRFGLNRAAFQKVFGSLEGRECDDIVQRNLNSENVMEVNLGLVSTIKFLHSSGWE